jgi:cysteine synthase A
MLESQIDTIGKTPLFRVPTFAPGANLFVKLESKNPAGSVKDRAVWGMIRLAEKEGKLKQGSIIVEPTSGNTGIGLAWISCIRGYKLILTMPETMSVERRNILKFLGAKVVPTDGMKGMQGAIDKAVEISEKENAFFPNQFSNPGVVQIHFETTGPEIWEEIGKKLDFAVFGVGTGGTLTGAGKFLKSKKKEVKIVAVEPADSPVISGGKPGPHKIQGIGAGFIPDILDTKIIHTVETVTNEDALSTSRELAEKEGIFVGISSGAAAHAARKIAQSHPNEYVMTILPDTAERYLSTDLFFGI